MTTATIIAGIPLTNATLYWKVPFSVGDPAAFIEIITPEQSVKTVYILRSIEMERARKSVSVDRVACPADFAPVGGLSGDRDTATAQAVVECLRQHGVTHATADRSLPFLFAEIITKSGIHLTCDVDLGVTGRRIKSDVEIGHIREAQRITEQAVRLGCEMILGATANPSGVLMAGGSPLTADRVRTVINVFLLEQGYSPSKWIVAPGRQGGDCHEPGTGEIRTGEPVIVDVYPRAPSRYCGDCTRTVVHGTIPTVVAAMHAAVMEAKTAVEHVIQAGASCEDIHRLTIATLKKHGYDSGLPSPDSPDTFTSMPHGTGHGVGLCVHESPLLDVGNPALLVRDVITVEPGLYCKSVGGVRVEDIVVVTETGCTNLTAGLPTDLQW